MSIGSERDNVELKVREIRLSWCYDVRMKKRELRIGGLYRHYKNKPYKVHGVVRHSETQEEMVLYEALYPNPSGAMWVRPLDMFLSDVEVDGKCMARFADDESCVN